MLKNKIFQYFFIEFFKIFLLITLSFSLLIWFTQAARLLELVTEFGNSIEVYIKYLLYSYPKILNNTFLLNFIISLFFLFSKLENQKEIQIYWLSGISKKKIYYICIVISIVVLNINLLLSNFLTPWSSFQGRLELGKSKFTLVNALVKEGNFNSPLKDLTIYVEKNDKKGNLEGIFIYEKSRTITAKTGQILSSNNETFLKLYKGSTQEKIGDKINFIKFKETIFDFSKYQNKNTSYPKFNERNLKWLIKNLNNASFTEQRKTEVREEINSRLIKPFLIIVLTSIISFCLISNNEKINLKKLKIFIYIFSVGLLIANQVMINFSGNSLNHTYVYIFFLILLFLIINFIFFKFLKIETLK